MVAVARRIAETQATGAKILLSTLTEVSLFEKGRPGPSTGVATPRPYIELGVEGAAPPPGGLGDVPPKTKIRGE